MEISKAADKMYATLREFQEAERKLSSTGKSGQARVQCADEYLTARAHHQQAIVDCEKAFEEAASAG
jgi:hypothetical protein